MSNRCQQIVYLTQQKGKHYFFKVLRIRFRYRLPWECRFFFSLFYWVFILLSFVEIVGFLKIYQQIFISVFLGIKQLMNYFRNQKSWGNTNRREKTGQTIKGNKFNNIGSKMSYFKVWHDEKTACDKLVKRQSNYSCNQTQTYKFHETFLVLICPL